MATTTKARSRRKPERRIRLIKPIQDGMGAFQILIDGEPHNYLILPMVSDFGTAFRLIKQELLPVDLPPTLSLPSMHTIRFFVYVIPISQPFASSRFLMAFTPRSARRIKGKENSSWLTWTKSQGPFWPLALWRQSGSFC